MGLSYPTIAIAWHPAYRVIPSRFPAISVFERVANPEDFAALSALSALSALEAMTNDRIRDEVGEISLAPVEGHLFGNGSTPIMAAFTHVNPQGSRFSDGSYGVFYCGYDKQTAIAELYASGQPLRTTISLP